MSTTRGLVMSLILLTCAATVWGWPFRRRSDGGAAGGGAVATATPAAMPGKSFSGPLAPLTDEQAALRDALRKDLLHLAGDIGERNVNRPAQLAEAALWIERSLTAAGYSVLRQTYEVKGRACLNLSAELLGRKKPDEIVIVGAHYDSVPGSPGANDNGSGVVAMLALARAMAKQQPDRTVRFLAFVNEEQPYFQSSSMGSMVYARWCRQEKQKIVGMLSLETIGYFSDAANSQHYPAPFSQYYPSTGNFIGFVGNVESAALVKQMVGSFRTHAQFPSEGAAAPASIDGVGWSDHWSFWQQGYPAVMVTDTALFRYPHYHKPTDTPDRVDYDRLARVVDGLRNVVADVARGE